jgi:peptidase M28-like protein
MRPVGRVMLVGLALLPGPAGWSAEERKDLVVIPQSAQSLLRARDEKVTLKAAAFFLAEWGPKHQQDMAALGLPFEVILADVREDDTLYLFELHDGEEPPPDWRTIYRHGRDAIVLMGDADAELQSRLGQHVVRLWHEPRGWGRSAESLVTFDCTHKPVIAGLLDKTSQAQWLDWIEKLSGTEEVQIAGAPYTIATRFTTTMFSGAANAKGFEFVKQQAQAWGFSGARYEEDPFTVGPSGKNLVLTIPGQTTDEVILSAHLDSIWQGGSSSTSAPGANDNGTGSATVLEAARLLRQYRFQRSIRLILFTGEEQGLFGSAAYTADHPLGPVAGVVNLDMFGWDGNGDRCFEIHAGTLPASIDVGSCFQTTIGAYALGLGHDFLTTTATDRSDHASFWNHDIGAIEIAENFFNDTVGGCNGADANPGYHSNNDRIATNMTPSYGFSIAKGGLATIAAMAGPIEACFAGAPAIGATGAPDRVDLSWAALAGAATYRVYRSTDGCGGTFVALGETASASYSDPLTTAGSYAYKVEAVTADSCYSLESNCATATPITSPSVTYEAGSASVIGDTGDGDLIADNCETFTVQVNLLNDGNQNLTGVRLSSVTSSHPGVEVVPTVPEDLGALAIGQTTPATFKLRLGQNGSSAACNQPLPLTVASMSDQSAPAPRALNLTAEAQGASGQLVFGFDGDLSGWALATGSFTVAPGGAPGSTTSSLHSRSANSICDAIVSPVLTPGSPSTLTMWVNFSIEGNAGAGSRWDRAIVRVINTTNGVKTSIAPTGVPYNTTGSDPALCDGIGVLQGWSGDRLTWSQASFDLTPFAGIPIQIEVRFSTDNSTLGTQGTAQGFWFDQVEITNASSISCDAQSNVCAARPAEVSPAGSPVPLTIAKAGGSYELRFSESGGATTYSVHAGTLGSLRAGVYDHDAAGSSCAIGDPTPGDGSVTTLWTPPDDSYVLAVAANASGESAYGQATAGPIPATLVSCP